MAITISGTPAAVNATSITLPTHAVGNIIIICATAGADFSGPITAPAASGTVPAWVTLDHPGLINTSDMITAYFVATATNHTSGTWTNANAIAAIVLAGQASSPIGGHAATVAASNATTATAPAITMTKTDGTSFLLAFFGLYNVTAWDAAPSGYTTQASFAWGGMSIRANSKNTTTSDGSTSQGSVVSAANNAGAQIEIMASVPRPARPLILSQAVSRASLY
jgi:hypothetical protein